MQKLSNNQVQKEELKLSPRNLQCYNKQHDHFICKICLKIVKDAKECQKCQNLFCNDCLLDWLQHNKSMCPVRCLNTSYNNVHRFALNFLKESQFKCNNQQCNQLFCYDQSLEHLYSCQYNLYECLNKCGQKIYGYQQLEHNQICKKYFVMCEHCHQNIYINEKNEHDCFQNMKQLINQLIKQKETQTKMVNVYYISENRQCNEGHELKRQFSQFNNHKVSCNMCLITNLQLHNFYYRCQSCQYNLCRACSLSNTLPQTLKVSIHQCTLKRNIESQNSGWQCDGTYTSLNCLSGINDFYQSYNIQGWRCQECDFDLCINCVLYFQA